MINTVSPLLFYPFDKGVLEWPNNNTKILFVNAQYINDTKNFTNIDVWQIFKPDANIWESNGIKTQQNLNAGHKYDYVFCALPKQKEESQYLIAQSIKVLKLNGTLIAVAANDAGGNRLEKWITALNLQTQSLSKSKCRIVWTTKDNLNEDILEQYIENGSTKNANGFQTQAGIYGWNNIDHGSKLLIENINEELQGTGADFGCGYGYLSKEILNKPNKIDKLYCIDADYRAIECCKENLKNSSIEIEYVWDDLTKKPKELPSLDFIIMNPPFHEGKKADTHIGKNFIKTAAHLLKKNGALHMVANVHLPYEETLEDNFFIVEKITEQNGFKIFKAVK